MENNSEKQTAPEQKTILGQVVLLTKQTEELKEENAKETRRNKKAFVLSIISVIISIISIVASILIAVSL